MCVFLVSAPTLRGRDNNCQIGTAKEVNQMNKKKMEGEGEKAMERERAEHNIIEERNAICKQRRAQRLGTDRVDGGLRSM